MDTDEICTIDCICCIQAVEVGRFNSIRDKYATKRIGALSYVFVPGYAVGPCIKNELSHPLLRTFFGFAIFGAPPTCAAGLPLSPLSQQLVSGKQQATIIWRMTLSHHGMALDLTFRSAPTRTADLTHVVLLQDAVPNATDRLMR